jgi:hypothetical protein
VAGSTVHITGAGACTITASQAGDGNYNPAPDVPQSFQIKKADQTITFAALADKTFGDPDFTVSATASSGLAVSFSLAAGGACTIAGATIHIVSSGSCTVTAAQGGNGNYNAAPSVDRTFAIVNSAAGLVLGQGVKPVTGGVASFQFDAGAMTANLVYNGPPTRRAHGKPAAPPVHFTAVAMTSIGIASDGNSAYIAGVGEDGRSYLVYVEDNTGPGSPKNTDDVFKLWIDGVLQSGGGALDQGKVTIHQGH